MKRDDMIAGETKLKVWFDSEGDYLEVTFDQRPGYFRETTNDRVMAKVDNNGDILGFSILTLSAVKQVPIDVGL